MKTGNSIQYQVSLALRKFIDSVPEPSGHAQRTLEFVEANPDCCSRLLTIGHVTGSAWVVDESGNNVLLTHHRFLDRWLQLGGHVDDGETAMEAALREAKEESGMDCIELISDDIFDVDVHSIPERGDEPAHFHYDIRYLFRVKSSESISISDESHDVAWVPISNLADYNDSESVMRMARRWMQQ